MPTQTMRSTSAGAASCSTDLEDIEDAGQGVDVHARSPDNRAAVILRKRFRDAKAAPAARDTRADSYIPGTQSVYVRTWGCSHNNSDGEYMAGLLAAYGYTITNRKDDADLWLLNSCTVKTPSEDTFSNEICKARELGKHVVVAGCVPQAQPRGKTWQDCSIIGVQQIDRVVEVVEETLQGRRVRLLGAKKTSGRKSGGARLDLPKIRKNPLIEIIPINTGCLNSCTYCKTKHARGDLGSYPPQDIVDRVKAVIEEGVVEIWLTSEDTGTYGRDIGSSLPELLWRIVDVLPQGVMLRVGMTNPPYIMEHLEEMAKILSHPRVYSFLHVPIQAASDAVLGAMRREYSQADFRHVVDFLREKVPGITIATDIIAGFPGETEDDFDETMKLCEEYKFPSLFINQFFPRPGTPAASMPRVHPQVVKQRTKRLSALFQSYFPYSHKMGEIQDVLVTDVATDKKHYVAHNKYFDQVLVPQRPELMGKMITVKIVRTGKHFLEGEVIEESLALAPQRPQPVAKGQVSKAGKSPQAAPANHSSRTGVTSRLASLSHNMNATWLIAFAVVLVLVDLLRVAWRMDASSPE